MRIVTHTCSNTEIVAALGCGDQIVGVDDHSDYPVDVVQAAQRIGPDLEPDLEQIKALKPDLVITSLTLPGHEKTVERIAESGLNYLVLEPKILADVPENIQQVAQIIGAEKEAQNLIRKFDSAMASPDKTQSEIDVLIEWWPKPVITPTRDSWVNEMLKLAGARNPFIEFDGKSQPIEDQQAIEANPDAIVMSWCGVPFHKYRKDIVLRRPSWQSITAIREKQIFPISEAWLGRPGPRLLEGISALKAMVRSVSNHKLELKNALKTGN